MQIVIEVMEDGMVSVSTDGAEPMGPMPAAEAMEAVQGMLMPEGGEEEMWNEEAAAMEAPDDEMMGDM